MIYLDYNATTPIDSTVRNAMLDCMENHFANPASTTHTLGIKSSFLLDECRETIASLIDASSDNILFTSGASESNNMVLKGVAEYFYSQGPVHFIVSEVEHKCIINQCHYLERRGINVSYAPVNDKGIVTLDAIKKLVNPATKLISVMAANNETGSLMPIKEIADFCLKESILFHSDAAQYIGKLPFSIQDIPVDFLSFSAHKFYGPKGIGGIYFKDKSLLSDSPLIHGGGQEYGLRGGTINLPAVVGMAQAAKITKERVISDLARQNTMKNRFIEQLRADIPDIQFNGCLQQSLPNTINLSLQGIRSRFLMNKLKNKLALSSGSACNSAQQANSHVLTAMGMDDDRIQSSIRLSFGRETTIEQLDTARKYFLDIYQMVNR
ncbi:cysteine desulfurase family protein [Photobacterium halotolerans]|uniref:cysteine desulfurase n=1 Tax=Photobacterium halotolerans TaxID=265726 RepID=A0A7X4WPB2_9GAMM|nr:cysteine desulfurase family protein [Photobacterium halotolerans]NAW67669.1 aminotransferase class V-fold PLP-dependent enzyme [Photobacterium halotolerans]NAW86304.1 aminotransferase class V-fold PLP-dependent enzyme [Photobacterium halotolerans]